MHPIAFMYWIVYTDSNHSQVICAFILVAELNNLLAEYVPLSVPYNTNKPPTEINANVNVPERLEEKINCNATVPGQNYANHSPVQAATTDSFPNLSKQKGTDKPHKCPLCDRTFRCISVALAHQGTHKSDQILQCDQCRVSYKSLSDLVQHQRIMHRNIFGARTRTSSQQIRESEDNGNPCPDCGRRFTKWNYLLRHRRTAHENLQHYVCEECGKVFKSSTSVHNHIKRTHFMLHRHTCEQCGKTFVNLKGLQKHTSVVHKT
ncbi:zinc finger protein 629 [Clonorchis sinensis]|uniref:Zinc finger protein 629 n=1 Tax=Clonorchis sinensis TaxID=79923 RepID=H2KPV8_CLOSI|nr:zinc finger protein 629 [Clonorchis sinensis]